jgi:predicted DNA repair protein MutK
MPSGLVALLDDISVIAKAASASVDDVAAAAGRAGTKTAGVVIDDAAVTPGYVTGLSPARELPIIWKITKGSLRNKLVFLLPGALLLSEFLPAAITWLLIIGGAFLCYEGAEKVLEKLGFARHGATLEDEITDPVAFENARVSGAIRTDLILSAEIMAIALAEVADESLLLRAAVLALVAVAVTLAVYGAVGLIVKLDDIGLHLMQKASAGAQAFGRFLLRFVPRLLATLSVIGTAAMLWVGGHIVTDSLHKLGLDWFYGPIHRAEHAVHAMTGAAGGVLGWLTATMLSAIFGLILGATIAFVLHKMLGVGAGEGH